ncbi:hypothetical protein BBP40_012172 [Aspergillus hancockii]|nr:hypothetical protein BBP40_012172 [Aspergillus hancockii]
MASTSTPFGAPMKEHFLFDPDFKNLNHGSYGTYPRTVQTALRQYQQNAEARPDAFIRITRAKGIDESRRAIAKLLNIPVNECVFVKNATTGVNTVLRNLDFKFKDAIIYFDTIYGAVEYGIVSLTESTPVQVRKVSYQFPISHDELVTRFRSAVNSARDEGLNVRAAVFDTIVSVPGVRFPFERLIEHLIRTTFPTSWGFIPRPTSSAPATQDKATKSAFEYLFEYVATADDTPYLCVLPAMKFRIEVCGGEEKIYAYLEKLAREGSDIIAQTLGTEVMQEPGLKEGESSLVPVITTWFRDTLINRYGTFVPVFQYGGWLWMRLSAQVYLDRGDFEWLAGVLNECCAKIETEVALPAKL